jgi:lysophospholipase L1-like esterase
VDVLNRGLADFNTQQFVEAGLPIVTKELASSSFTPMVITLWFGLDNAALTDGPTARHQVHVDKYYDNLVHILRTFRKQSPGSKILVVSPLVVDDDARQQVLVQRDELSGPIDRTNNLTKAYAAAAAEAASVLRDVAISHLDLYSYLMETYPNTTGRAALFRDGLHLNEEGHRVVFEQVQTRIELIVPASMLQTAQIPLPETARVGH